MTNNGHMESINIAKLKERLSEVIRRVREGEDFTVLDRQTPVARITGIASSSLGLAQAPSKPFAPPRVLNRTVLPDAQELLRRDRDKR